MSNEPTRLRVNDIVRLRLPWSEVCIHMKVAEQERNVRVLRGGAQILNEDGSNFSFPILHAEAGIYRDIDGFYAFGERENKPDPDYPHMRTAQRYALERLCERFKVAFDGDNFKPTFDLPTGFVAGRVGPIYVGCSPEGEISS